MDLCYDAQGIALILQLVDDVLQLRQASIGADLAHVGCVSRGDRLVESSKHAHSNWLVESGRFAHEGFDIQSGDAGCGVAHVLAPCWLLKRTIARMSKMSTEIICLSKLC